MLMTNEKREFKELFSRFINFKQDVWQRKK